MFTVLRKGMPVSSAEVYRLQNLLNTKVIPSPNLKPDGIFGQSTHDAVVQFQKSAGLNGNGIVDQCVWDMLESSVSRAFVHPKQPASPHLLQGIQITGKSLPPKGERVLREILLEAGLQAATVIDTTRTYREQANTIIHYYTSHGAAEAKKTYSGGPGHDAIEIYEANKTNSAVVDLMTDVIRKGIETERHQPGGQKHLMHCSETHIVFDVAVGTTPTVSENAFTKAVKSHPSVSRFLYPGSTPPDKAYHIEIPANE